MEKKIENEWEYADFNCVKFPRPMGCVEPPKPEEYVPRTETGETAHPLDGIDFAEMFPGVVDLSNNYRATLNPVKRTVRIPDRQSPQLKELRRLENSARAEGRTEAFIASAFVMEVFLIAGRLLGWF